MAVETRELYSSPNGDRWFLGRDAASGDVFVRHEPNVPSGGRPSDIDISEFLSRGRGRRNPEHQALLHLIGTLVADCTERIADHRPPLSNEPS
jgi:hypothetical protein